MLQGVPSQKFVRNGGPKLALIEQPREPVLTKKYMVGERQRNSVLKLTRLFVKRWCGIHDHMPR